MIADLHFKPIFISLVITLLSSPSWSTPFNELVERDGLYYKKFSNVPFSGEVNGLRKGNLKNGKKEGVWVEYWDNGQLMNEGVYKNDKAEGAWVGYWDNGQIHYKGNFKNGKKEGGWISYHRNSQLEYKGNYKNDKEEGAWVYYSRDGSSVVSFTGNFKNGVKISD